MESGRAALEACVRVRLRSEIREPFVARAKRPAHRVSYPGKLAGPEPVLKDLSAFSRRQVQFWTSGNVGVTLQRRREVLLYPGDV